MRARLFFLALLLAALFQADVGWARDWRVERVNGTAWTIESAEKRNVLAVGMMVPEGLTIATAESGRIRLSSENNVMTLGPGSIAVVKPKEWFNSKTEVLQRVGSIAFDIEKRSAPHFTVQTPFMAAVVKGTAFTISVTKTDTKIGVDRGLVQVQDLRTGETAGIGAGQRASVSTKTSGLTTAGINAPAVTQGKPSAPSVAPVGQTLSDARKAQAAEAARASASSAASAGSPAAAASSHSSGPSQFGGFGDLGGFGGDSSGERGSIGGVSQTEAAAPGTQGSTADRNAPGEAPGAPGNASPSVNGGGGDRRCHRRHHHRQRQPERHRHVGNVTGTVGTTTGNGSPSVTGTVGNVTGHRRHHHRQRQPERRRHCRERSRHRRHQHRQRQPERHRHRGNVTGTVGTNTGNNSPSGTAAPSASPVPSATSSVSVSVPGDIGNVVGTIGGFGGFGGFVGFGQ